MNEPVDLQTLLLPADWTLEQLEAETRKVYFEDLSKNPPQTPEFSWLEKRTLIVVAERAQVRAQPDDAAAVLFGAERDVVLELVEPGPTGWVRVQHRNGQQGYVKAVQVWGI